MKVQEVRLTGWTFLHLVKFYSQFLNVKIKFDIIVAVDELSV